MIQRAPKLGLCSGPEEFGREHSTERQLKMDMISTELYEQLNRVFHDVFDDDTIKVTPEMTAEDVESWDSLSNIRLIATVERTFKVKFTMSEIGKLKNVGELVALIQKRR
jgi:acyl carrier protein